MMMMVARRASMTGVALAVICLIAGVRLQAHEIGTTRVTVRFPAADQYLIEVVTDGQALLDKLGTSAGSAAFDDRFRDRIALRFDDQAARPDIRTVFTPAVDEWSPPVATVTLTGLVPSDAHRLTWSYGWTFASYAFSVEQLQGSASTQWLEGDEASRPIPLDLALPPAPRWEVVWQYLRLGFTHIVPKGLDHILFVLGLFLLSTSWRSLLWQVSAFTVAHTITLGLAMNGLVAARPSLVEPLIAASIGYVAIENVLLRELKPWRIGLVFVFGLLHGLGFAGVLSELGLPRGQFATALVAFNVGVEGGQLFVIGAAVAAVGWWRSAPCYRQRVVVPASVVIACVAMYWTVLRLT